ncbi:hypothetical protein GA0116948_105275 [Chitinophaga costaii]|uniref:Short chain amide porin n=1 Tax=Chitinophaga costaii TaxID=1335309 RepID=A0A1C4DHF2_9BACT|nr:hypothetical protein [Chitinophaga costaii]PUZ24635.1 hypothetical protein DCM91_12135 [Chitinophaga costaii]SCC30753.1 hypothetical protein GA0116948_105275 [Chitinophaga costaii]
MKIFHIAILLIGLTTLSPLVWAGDGTHPPKKKSGKKRGTFLLELPASLNTSPVDSVKRKPDSIEARLTTAPAEEAPFKPSIQVGAIVHMFASAEQSGFGAPSTDADSKGWNKGFSVYRARVLVGGQLSKKGSFFMETDLPSAIGTQLSSGVKNVKVAPIILDAQYEYDFANAFSLVAGMQLVSNNRNGLQGAGGLMANDFTYFQYPYNLFANSPLQGNFGRDLGVNARGFLANDKLEYRVGVFTGRNIDGGAPLRTVGRVVYNFLDPDKDYYYAGTKLGKGKTLSWGAGWDEQASYYNFSTDVFFDHPLGDAGSLTLNAAFQYMTGGTNLDSKYSFATLIPKQTVQYLELGYYFKEPKLQPWIRFENQHIDAAAEQTNGVDPSAYNKLNSSAVYGGGLNYFFNGSTTNLRLSYTARSYHVATPTEGVYDKQTYGQVWLQVQFFIF